MSRPHANNDAEMPNWLFWVAISVTRGSGGFYDIQGYKKPVQTFFLVMYTLMAAGSVLVVIPGLIESFVKDHDVLSLLLAVAFSYLTAAMLVMVRVIVGWLRKGKR